MHNSRNHHYFNKFQTDPVAGFFTIGSLHNKQHCAMRPSIGWQKLPRDCAMCSTCISCAAKKRTVKRQQFTVKPLRPWGTGCRFLVQICIQTISSTNLHHIGRLWFGFATADFAVDPQCSCSKICSNTFYPPMHIRNINGFKIRTAGQLSCGFCMDNGNGVQSATEITTILSI